MKGFRDQVAEINAGREVPPGVVSILSAGRRGPALAYSGSLRHLKRRAIGAPAHRLEQLVFESRAINRA